MSSRKQRRILRNWHIEQLKPKIVYRYGKEIEDAMIQQDIEDLAQNIPDLKLLSRLATMRHFGHACHFLNNWLWGFDTKLRFIIPSGKVRVRNVVIYWER